MKIRISHFSEQKGRRLFWLNSFLGNLKKICFYSRDTCYMIFLTRKWKSWYKIFLKCQYYQLFFSHTETLTCSQYRTLFFYRIRNNRFVLSTNFCFGVVYNYNILNITISQELIEKITMLHSHQIDIITIIQNDHILIPTYDCGRFVLAYAIEVVIGNTTGKFLFDQSEI